MRCTLPPLALLALIAAIQTALAQTAPLPPAWKWRDAQGQIHVSDLPPPASVAAKDILERPPVQRRVEAARAAASAPPPAASAPRTDAELEARRKRAADDQVAQQKAAEEKNSAIKAENCGRARQHLQGLSDGHRIARTNAQGEREVIDDKTRADEMQRARSIIASDCAK